jgi:hypothetical protein
MGTIGRLKGDGGGEKGGILGEEKRNGEEKGDEEI